MPGFLARGLAAGAAGTTVLNAVTHLDTAVRGREESSLPGRLVDAAAKATGTSVPGRGQEARARRNGLGALAGIADGLLTGVLASAARSSGIRFPGPVGAVAAGAAAMAATNVPAAVLGLTDPRTWTAADWMADAAPHLAYGVAVQSVLEAMPGEREQRIPREPAGAGLAFRSFLLGVASGARSSLGWAMPTVTAPSRKGTPEHRAAAVKLGAAATVAAELVGDKQPGIPARTTPAGAAPRFLGAVVGATQLATRARANAAVPALVAAGGAAVGTWGGLGWRLWLQRQLSTTQAGLVEDGAALLLAAVACLPGRTNHRSVRVRRVQWVDAR